MNVDEMKDYLSEKGVCAEVADNFYINQINGETFKKLI